MSPSKQANSVEDAGLQQQNQQQSQQNKFTELLQKTVKDFSKWSTTKQMAAVSIVGAGFFTVLPVLLAASPFIATGAVVGLALFFTVNAALYAFKALVWSGKKAKDGFKYVAKETVKGAVYSKDKVVDGFGSLKRGVSAVGSTMREGTSDTLKTVGRKLSGLGESMGDSDSIPYSITHKDKGITPLEEEKTKKFSNVREMFFKEIFQDKISNKSALVEKVLSRIGSKMAEKAYSVPNEGVGNSKLINQLEKQADFISKLDAKKLKDLLAENNYDPQLYKIFSEYHDEIKSIIKECKKEQTRVSTIERLNSSAKRSRSKSAPAQPTSSLPESGSSNSLNSVSTDGSEERQKVKSKFWTLPRLGRSAKETKEKIQEQSSSDLEADFTRFATTRANRNPSQARGPIPVEPPKPPRAFMTRSDSSGNLNSSMNYPEGLNPFAETVSTGPDFITNIGDKLRTRSNSSVSLASTSNFVSTSSRLSDSESANSFSFSRTPTSPAQSFEAWSEENKQCRNSSPSIDSGVSSAGSSTPKKSSSMRDINTHSAPQVPVALNELRERRNSLTKTGSLKKLVPPNSQTELPKVQHPASKAPDVPSNSSRCILQ